MGTLEKVLDMKKQGLSEREIITRLKSENISPMEINDSINQSKIKEAIGNSNSYTQGMVPSIMGTDKEETNNQIQDNSYDPNQNNPYAPPQNQLGTQGGYEAQPPTPYDSQGYGNPQPPMENYFPMEQGEEQYYDDGYSPEEYSQGYSSSSDTIIEIAEQVFTEKIKKIEKQLSDLMEFKTIYSTRIDDINERLKRIEKYFDKMQMTIIDKVGTYGKELESIKKEMNMIEDSFGKISGKK
jgi:hypothetical protein